MESNQLHSVQYNTAPIQFNSFLLAQMAKKKKIAIDFCIPQVNKSYSSGISSHQDSVVNVM